MPSPPELATKGYGESGKSGPWSTEPPQPTESEHKRKKAPILRRGSGLRSWVRARGGTRTRDLLVMSQTSYRLLYSGAGNVTRCHIGVKRPPTTDEVTPR